MTAPAPLTDRAPLVVGYGNPLRSDDGLGWHVAAALLDDGPHDGAAGGPLHGARVLQRQQLTPELATDVAAARLVVFVDARADGEGGVLATPLVPAVWEAGQLPSAWTHHLSPERLLGLTRDLTGAAPPAFLVTAPVASVETSDTLTPEGRQRLPEVVDRVLSLLRES